MAGRRASGCIIQIATLNVGTMRGQFADIAEMLSWRNVDICCAQETRWKSDSARKNMGKNCHYKIFWKGDESGHGGEGTLIKEKWSESVLSIYPGIMMLKMLIVIMCVYVSQVGLSNHDTDAFYEQLLTCILSTEDSEIDITGNFNGRVGEESGTFDTDHGGKRPWHKKS